jgi:CRP-like cAMP-binding protein
VELADRLRRVPLFDFTHIDELFRLAGLGRQVRYEKGRMLFEHGQPVTSIQFLLDGAVLVGTQKVSAPAALGFEELLEGSPMPAWVSAAERAITLSLTADEFLALLSENVELAEGIFRMLIESRRLTAGHPVIHGNLKPELASRPIADLRPIDRVLLLQGSPLLAHATAPQLWRLSAISREVKLASGAEALQKGGEPAILVVLSGSINVEPPGASPESARPGDVIGMYETLAGARFTASAAATAPAQLLRIDRGALFELLADHTDLLQGIFSILLSRGRATARAQAGPDGGTDAPLVAGSPISNTVSTP